MNKNIFLKNRGEITTQQIVILIIAITGFMIVLFVLFRLNLINTSNNQICHNSVILKSKGGLVGGKLDCKTDYVCISEGGKCEGIPISTTIKIKTKEEIMKAIADEMVDCWWMFGEGQAKYGGDWGATTCGICSVIAFDENILEKLESGFENEENSYEISYREFYNYLNSIEKSDQETYFTYLYNSYDVDLFQEQISQLSMNIDNNFIISRERYDILTGIKNENHLYVYYLQPNYLSSLNPSCTEYITSSS